MDQRETAETRALQAIAWIAGQDDLLGVFLGASGLSEGDLRAQIDQPELMAAVLDFLLMDDAWVIQFCDAHGIGYEQVMQARQALPGGATVHWT